MFANNLHVSGSVLYNEESRELAFISPVEAGLGGSRPHLLLRGVGGAAAGLQATPLTFGPWSVLGLLAWDQPTSSM
jgi:hypothetical protein